MSATALALAFGGGVVSLLSPCVLPVIPAYLSITTGLGMSEPQSHSDLRSDPESRSPADPRSRPEQRPRGRPGLGAVLCGGGLFVAGFSVVFVALGLSATAIGSLLLRNHVPVTRVSGLAVIVMALALLTSTLPLPWLLGRELRFHPQVSRYGMWAAPVAGAAFAFGWTPCIGPVLGSVLAVAADQRQLAQGAALLAVYAAGLALPFLIIALTFHRSLIALRFVRRHSILLTRASATVLAGYGVLLAFDQLSWFTLQVQHGATALGLTWLVGLG
jgi:cytochrome c-type biogenesis protein